MTAFRARRMLLCAAMAGVCIAGGYLPLAAQEADHNIIIEKASEDIRFMPVKKGDGDVQIAQISSTLYRCRDFRTTLPVADFYNNETSIDAVRIYIDGSRNKSIEPKYDYYSQDDIFYSDARVCHFNVPFENKGAKAEVVFEKTISNPVYFTSVYFPESQEVEEKTVTITVPEWMTIELKEMNFEGWGIGRSKARQGDATVYTYTLRNARGLRQEANAPGPSYFMPHLLVMAKESRLDGVTKTYFKTLADQYKWYHSLTAAIGNDETGIRAKVAEITAGKTSDTDKVRAIYYWVQQHIRYIAYEDGIAGFKPEKAQEVLRKKYGDCKGMANLLATMLRSIGYDARLCWLGTNHIAYDYSTPSLGVDNHMIAAWMRDGRPVFLDGTEKFLAFGETAERIQGRQILIENGDGYLLQTIPVVPHSQNTATELRVLLVDGQDLKGRVTHRYRGENREAVLDQLDRVKLDRRDEALRRYLSAGNASYQISNLVTTDLGDANDELVVTYDLVQKGAFTKFGADQYLDVDNRRQFADYVVDTAKHHLPFVFPFKDHQVLDVRITLPAGAKAKSLPGAVVLNKPAYGYSGTWSQKDAELRYHAETWMEQTYFPVAQFPALNGDLQALKKFYNAQPELSF